MHCIMEGAFIMPSCTLHCALTHETNLTILTKMGVHRWNTFFFSQPHYSNTPTWHKYALGIWFLSVQHLIRLFTYSKIHICSSVWANVPFSMHVNFFTLSLSFCLFSLHESNKSAFWSYWLKLLAELQAFCRQKHHPSITFVFTWWWKERSGITSEQLWLIMIKHSLDNYFFVKWWMELLWMNLLYDCICEGCTYVMNRVLVLLSLSTCSHHRISAEAKYCAWNRQGSLTTQSI